MPTHVELYASLLILSSRLGRPRTGVRNLPHVASAGGRLRRSTSETCEERLEEVFSRAKRRLCCGVLFFEGIMLGRNGNDLRIFAVSEAPS
jgi:hypothetical protein